MNDFEKLKYTFSNIGLKFTEHRGIYGFTLTIKKNSVDVNFEFDHEGKFTMVW